MNDRYTPTDRLPHASISAWRVINILWTLLFMAIPTGLWVLWFTGYAVPGWWRWGSVAAVLVLGIVLVGVVPIIRWKRWRYRIDEDEIQMRRGIIIIEQRLIPIKRVQHVDTRQGPVLRWFSLADVLVSTAATTHRIPALAASEADHMRGEISAFARKAKDDV